MSQKHYTEDHEWISVHDTQNGSVVRVGISAYAAEQLGEIVFVELPQIGQNLSTGDGAAVLESVKAASDVYAPLSGTITQINQSVVDHSDLISSDPEDKGWLFEIHPSDALDLSAFLTPEEYAKHSN